MKNKSLLLSQMLFSSFQIEKGKKRFSAEVLCQIAKTLDVSCDYIMFGRIMQGCDDGFLTCFSCSSQ